MFQLCSMRSCNVDEFEYHRPEELPILCRYNFGGTVILQFSNYNPFLLHYC